jgi:chaperonin GroEL (HSP60 family)
LKTLSQILEKVLKEGYPYTYDVLGKEVVNSIKCGIVDSAKSVRAILWNSLTIVSTIITSD